MSGLRWDGKDGAPMAKVRQRGFGECITCGRPAVLINPSGQDQHKVCAERESWATQPGS